MFMSTATFSTATRHYRLRRAADVLWSGGVVCHPTEAVWGLACLPGQLTAVQRIWDLKQRDPAKGLILVSDSAERFAPLLEGLPAEARERVLASWPGPNTWVLPDLDFIPVWIRGRFSSVAVRVSDHKLTRALCRAADSALVSTSANPAGAEPATNQAQAQRYFARDVDYYLPGATGGLQQPTTIRDALTGQVLR